MIELRAATLEDAVFLAPRLRQLDLAEIMRDEDSDPLAALVEGVRTSAESWVVTDDGVVFCLGGIREADDGSGIIWLLGSDEVSKHPKDFLLASRRMVECWQKEYSLIHNFVGANSHESKRYLRWLGFVIEPKIVVVGSRQVPFQYFWWRGDEDV